VLRTLQTFQPPEGLVHSLQSAEVTYDLVHGWDYADSIIDHVKTNSRQGVMDIYKVALGGAPHCGIIRARRPQDGAILGSVVIYNERASLAEHMPAMKATHASTGGISSPVISPSVGEYATLLQGLILLGIKQIRRQGAEAVIVDCVDADSNFDWLTELGFSTLHSFEEVNCDAATWTMVPGP
jgi:beta-N-acetylhexosaminidase